MALNDLLSGECPSIAPRFVFRAHVFTNDERDIGVSKVAEMFQVPVDRAKEITRDWLRPEDELVEDGDL
jgi:hypothetical protein